MLGHSAWEHSYLVNYVVEFEVQPLNLNIHFLTNNMF